MSLKILLADDSMTAQNMGKKILTDAGYEVIAVSNGAAAVKKIAEISPQLCILDIYMPGYTGLEVCEKVKSSSATARMPVLLTVGKMEPYKPEEGARVRADGVIVKPFEASELLRAVHRFSQRIAGGASRPPSSPPPSTSATYERTVKLTREQIQEYMEPGRPNWNGGTTSPDAVATVPGPSVEGVVANTKTASTADRMPTFAVTAVADEAVPAAFSEIHETAAMVDLATSPGAVEEISQSGSLDVVRIEETPFASASAGLPGFVDYLLTDKGDFAVDVAEPQPSSEAVVVRLTSAAIDEGQKAHSSFTDDISAALAAAQAIGYKIPAVDPALEIGPEVAIEGTPDPQLESTEDLVVENATEIGLQPTSRADESAGVVTTTDPNLSPMEGLTDAVHPLEGGRLVIPVKDPVEDVSSLEVAAVQPSVMETAEDAIVPVSEPAVAIEAFPSPAPPTRKSKRSKEMRAIMTPIIVSPSTLAEDGASSRDGKGNVTEEIAAVLDMLGQTTSATLGAAPSEAGVVAGAAVEEASTSATAASPRVWMAEEVALSDYEATLSLENEMRVAYAPKVVDPGLLIDPMSNSEERESRLKAEMAAALAEDQVRDDKIAPQAAVPNSGGSPPEAGISPTQELAAAMAAAFGGALPQEDLARAEETQSISEEVRRFALGDAYKPKPTFGGAAIEEPGEKVVNLTKLSAAIGRALDRMKPQLVAEILKELKAINEE